MISMRYAWLVPSGEGEILFSPLSHLEVVDFPRLERHDEKSVVVIKIKVNVNKSRTLEQNLELRKQMVITAGENLKKEILFDLKLVSDKPFELSDFNKGFEILKEPTPDWFNSDINYKSALEKLLDLKQRTITNLVRQLADMDHAVRSEVYVASFLLFFCECTQNMFVLF